MARWVLGPRKEPLTIILLNIVLNQLLMTYCYTHGLVCLSTLIAEGFICNRWWLKHRSTSSQRAKAKRRQNAQTWMGHLYHTLSSRGSGITVDNQGAGRVSEPEAVNDYKGTVFQIQQGSWAHVLKQLRQCGQWTVLVRLTLERISASRGEEGMKFHT